MGGPTHSWVGSLEGPRIADRNYFGINFHFIADTDTEKYTFRIISARTSDKRSIRKPLNHVTVIAANS